MGVTLNRVAPDEPPMICGGCGYHEATARIETCPDADVIPPEDLPVCDVCIAELKASICGGTVTPGARGGKVGRNHPETSVRAAANVESGTQQAALLRIVDLASVAERTLDDARRGFGVTCAEAAGPLSLAVGHVVSRNQTATRMGELGEKGLVRWLTVEHDGMTVPVKRTTEGDNEGHVWVCTAAGLVEAARLR